MILVFLIIMVFMKKIIYQIELKILDVIDFKFIKDKNIFGMTNTAIKLNGIEKVSFDKEIIAVDWYF